MQCKFHLKNYWRDFFGRGGGGSGMTVNLFLVLYPQWNHILKETKKLAKSVEIKKMNYKCFAVLK